MRAAPFAIVISVALAAAVGTAFSLSGIAGLAHGTLIDTDSYLRIVLLRDALDGSPAGFVSRDNAPFGFFMHWTRAFDLFALGAALPIAAFMPFDRALVWSAGLSSPIHVAILAGLVAWSVRHSGPRVAILGGWCIAVSLAIQGYGVAGRADHHIYCLLPLAVGVGAAMRAVQHKRRSWDILLGISAAAAIWITVETLPFVLGLFAFRLALGACASLNGQDAIRDTRVSVSGVTFALTMAVLFAIDPPAPHRFAPEIDRLSIVFVVAAALLSIALSVSERLIQTRMSAIFVALPVLAALVLWVLLFPTLLSGPEAVIGTELRRLWWDHIRELQPARTAFTVAAFVLPAAIAATDAAVSWLRTRRLDHLALSILAVAAALLAWRHLRFGTYAAVFGTYALILCAGPRLFGAATTALRTALVFACVPVVTILLPVLLHSEDRSATAGCRIADHADALAAMPASTILSDIDLAPELLYWTRHRTVSGPYQRNIDGLRDAYTVFLAEADKPAREILARRNVDFLLICMRQTLSEGSGAALRERIRSESIPSWLVKTDVLDSASGLMLLKVQR